MTTMKTLNPFKVVLLVDDDKEFHELYALQLDDIPAVKFLYAQSGEEAYKLMALQKIDVVISDIDMPDGNGFWLLNKLSSEYLGVPVIMASGNPDVTEEELIKLGAKAFVSKLNLPLLLTAVLRQMS